MRGRPSNASRLALEADLFLAVEALKQIASGDMLRQSAAILGRPWESLAPDTEAFQWAQNYAKGTLTRLGLGDG